MAKTRRTSRRASKGRSGSRRSWWLLLVVLAVALAAVVWTYRAPIYGNAEAGTAYAAHVTCSCRFIEGRSMSDCEKDKVEGMELIYLSEDDEAKSVTATFPLVHSDTATFREGYGCVLQPWER